MMYLLRMTTSVSDFFMISVLTTKHSRPRRGDRGVLASVPDLLRLLSVPVLAWAAYHDVRTRRVSNRVWPPLLLLAVALLLWEGWRALAVGGFTWTLFAIGAGISLFVVAPLSYAFWRFGAFGGADAKALIVLAVLFPTFPTYQIGSLVLPVQTTPTGAFALTILSNTVVVGALYPVALATRNALAGRVTPAMFVGWPVRWDEAERTHGRLLETTVGFTRSGLDLDALRMYLRWRGATLSELRSDPARYRDPGSLPADPLPAGDGAITDGGEQPKRLRSSSNRRFDGGEQTEGLRITSEQGSDGGVRIRDSRTSKDERSESSGDERVENARSSSDLRSDGGEREFHPNAERSDGGWTDEWGAETFLADVGSAYGTTPEGLREGLDVLTIRERVWVSPGIPFIVPILVGLIVALTYGDLLVFVLEGLELA